MDRGERWKKSLLTLQPEFEDAARRFPDLRMAFLREYAENLEGGMSWPDYGPREVDLLRHFGGRKPCIKLFWDYSQGEREGIIDCVRFYGEEDWANRFMELAQCAGNCVAERIPSLAASDKDWSPDEPEIPWILGIFALACEQQRGTICHARKTDAWFLGYGAAEGIELFHSVLPISPFRASVELIDLLTADAEPGSPTAVAEPDKPKPIKPPSKKALQAWRLKTMLGLETQQAIADEMTRQGTRATQGDVSRWLKEVEACQAAGYILPDPPHLDSKPEPIDPDVIEMGARQDGRTPRQRHRRDPDAD